MKKWWNNLDPEQRATIIVGSIGLAIGIGYIIYLVLVNNPYLSY